MNIYERAAEIKEQAEKAEVAFEGITVRDGRNYFDPDEVAASFGDIAKLARVVIQLAILVQDLAQVTVINQAHQRDPLRDD